jgi:selenium metabolism protein YedF
MRIIDARNQPCPQPVLLTRNALEQAAPGEELEILLNTDLALTNVSNLLRERSVGFQCETAQGEHRLRVINPETCACAVNFGYASSKSGARTIVLKQEWMGHGSEELGRLLIKGFVNALPEIRPLPDVIICYNAGVRFAIEGSPVLEALQRLEIAGVKIFLCGTCLDYFELRDQIRVGTVTNMLKIIELLNESATVIYP